MKEKRLKNEGRNVGFRDGTTSMNLGYNKSQRCELLTLQKLQQVHLSIEEIRRGAPGLISKVEGFVFLAPEA